MSPSKSQARTRRCKARCVSVHYGGTVVAASCYQGSAPLELNTEWHYNRLTLISSMPVWGMPHRCAPMWDRKRLEQTAYELLRARRLVTEPMIGRRFSYADAAEAYAFIDAHPDYGIKTIFEYPQGG